MANPGVGTKFVSVNLNKSYGQPHHHHSSHPNSYGSNRTRPGSHGAGGGMVVLSRPRSSQKPGPKLSVPPPLNLPSLRKEHERLDSLGSGAGPAGGGVLGNGQRPTSAGMGWTKPRTNDLPEKEGLSSNMADRIDPSLRTVDGASGGSSVYMPPSARAGMTGPVVTTSASSQVYAAVEKAPVLRGEDFPSLQATLPSAAGPSQKLKDGPSSKLKRAAEGSYEEQRDTSHLSSSIDARPKFQSAQKGLPSENAKKGDTFSLGSFQSSESSRKQEDLFPGPLPLVSMNPRSDWADDERDTSHGLIDRGRDRGHPKSEAYWERDFDMPRVSALPHKPIPNFSQRWNLRDDESGKFHSNDIHKVDPYGRDARTPSREGWEGNFRRNTPIPKDGFGSDSRNDRNDIAARPTNIDRETNANSMHVSHFREHAHKDPGRRDTGYGQMGRQTWNSAAESYSSQEPDRVIRDKYGSEQHNRERRSFAKIEKPYMEDPFMKDFGASGFDGRDPFATGIVGVVKRKKDVIKQTDFHDPVRESFEAELERVQQIQEQERQRIIEEQERALELARREEEERKTLAREHEERQRRAEEEAREAAWRAEQERLEAIQKAEELRIAREEEKQRIILEEERRKQAAKLMLLELEERMAKRQAETVKSSTSTSDIPEKKIPGVVKDVSRLADAVDWEDGEKMVERITTSASSESSSINRSSEVGLRSQFSRDASPAFVDRGKSVNSWRRDFYERGSGSQFVVQDQSTGYNGPRREAPIGGRATSRKEFYGGAGFTTSRISHRRGITEPQSDDYSQLRGHRPNLSGGGDHYSQSPDFDSEFQDNVENFGDHGWRQETGRNNFYFPYPERVNPISETDGSYSVGRSRYSQRQPRVLPPPSVASIQKSSVRGEYESVPRDIVESEIQYDHPARNVSTAQTGYIHHENRSFPEIIDVNLDNAENEEQKPDCDTTLRCDSQSTLSVFSPPTSPTHLSHEDLDDSGDSPVLSASREGTLSIEDTESAVPTKCGKEIMISSTRVSTGDEDEWAVGNEHVQEQEEYDEDDDGYDEEDEVHEVEDENIDLAQDFDDLHLDDKGSPHMLDNLVLGFNEGVEVGMPNDEFERISGNEENMFVTPEISSCIREEQGSSEVLQVDSNICQYPDASSQVRIPDTEEMKDLVILSKPAQALPGSELTEQGKFSCRSGVSVQLPISSSVSMASQSPPGQVIVPNAAISGQAEPPVKLQFGLFSGPSLIPSPVPAIQIGSIQMPLHLHAQITPSMTHMHSSQPPLFQFGQLRYTSSVSQGVLPLAPQPLTFVPPTVQTGFPLNKNPGDAPSIQTSQETCAHNSRKNDVLPFLMDNQQGLASRSLNSSGESKSLPLTDNKESEVITQQDQTAGSCIDESNSRSESGFQAEHQRHHHNVSTSDDHYVVTRGKESEGRAQDGMGPFDSVSRDKGLGGSKARGQFHGGRGKKYIFTVKNSGSRLSFPASESTRLDSSGFQRRPRRNAPRTEFRVRETVDKKSSNSQVSSSNVEVDDKPTVSGRSAASSARNGTRKVVISTKPSKRALESEGLSSGVSSSLELDAGNRTEKGVKKEYLGKSQGSQYSGEGNFRKNICSGEDVDAPLQSGIIRVFEQPGIEAPSDEDDFIEVRSKRQMLNDRREQREKEIKAKSHNSKIPRRSRSNSKIASSSVNSSKVYAAKEAETVKRTRSDFVATDGRGSGNIVVSSAFSSPIVSQPLAPIGTPALKSDSQTERSHTARSIQSSAPALATGDGRNLESSSMFDKKNDILDNVQTSFASWGGSRINQQVMALTQTQLDEAMKPAQFDLHPPVGDHSSLAGDPNVPSPSILARDRSFSSAANPISSLLAGEKIQFGAVTSPTVLPPGSCATLLGIGPTGLCHSDIQIPHKLSGAENDCHIFFEKEKHHSESCTHIEDSEAEAEAAASAVAVAAISSDEIVTNGLGTCSVSVTDTNNFGSGDINVITAGSAGDQQLASKTRADDSLTVALPADLSVETPPISLWPTLPSPQNSSSQMLSHFPGGSPSQFPFYEINPMLGGPVFTFGPHDESVSTTQSQTQKSSAPAPGPLGSWKQCHSGVDSFYGPPGFSGPFISPGGIPGVQGPPHMVVYNHFAPVGQFGQVGLSFMGATYIPSGKQHDWKHSPGPSSLGVEGDQKTLNMVSAQRMPTNLPPIQHLAPGSPLLPMASPLAMFDVSPFQASPEMSVQARWPSSASSVQPVPLSMPLQQQQAEGVLPSHFSHSSSADPSFTVNRFPGSQPSVASDHKRNFSVATDATVTQLPDELGIVDASSCVSSGASVPNVDINSLSVSSVTDAGKTGVQNCSSNNSGQNSGTNLKSQSPQHKGVSTQQYSHSSGYNFQRGGASQKHSSGGGEWSHRRTGFMGRNQSGAEKNFSSAKMKQIYVAKQTSSGNLRV
ncbi:uncharacterized protein LOC111005936 isoform X2 [Momordica charantia]|uniref:Uncharacterized protein LOC111005936 isoform X2 n=1 Tax=Momordica charantia TaxID=3673 RepID=A0A6J1BUR5_MOMCH|nr:uncharacterized protein LOC111005936 isoform X2 [Momordica charantia]